MNGGQIYFWIVVALTAIAFLLILADAIQTSRRLPGGSRFVTEEEIRAIEREIAP